MRSTIAKLLPETAEGLIAEMDKWFPEPRPSPKDSHEEMIWQSARRSVYLQVRDLYARKKH